MIVAHCASLLLWGNFRAPALIPTAASVLLTLRPRCCAFSRFCRSCVFNSLEPLFAQIDAAILCFQQLAASFAKTPGWGGAPNFRRLESTRCGLFFLPHPLGTNLAIPRWPVANQRSHQVDDRTLRSAGPNKGQNKTSSRSYTRPTVGAS